MLNTADVGGGAEQTAMRVLNGLLERDVDAWLAVGVRSTDHERVVAVNTAPLRGRSPGRLECRAWNARRSLDRRLGREDFAFPSTRWIFDQPHGRPDVVLAFNLHGGYFDLTRLPAISAAAPLVLSLQDSWMFTGHCAVTGSCGRWEGGCGKCPDLALPPAVTRDRTAANWRRKGRLLRHCEVDAIAPSRWLLDRARRSLLAPALRDCRVVPRGIDLEIFCPGRGAPGRAALGIEQDKAMALYVANGGLDNPYKDGALLVAAAKLAAELRPLELVVVGGAKARVTETGPLRIHERPFLHERGALADLYRAADVYVHAAVDESFCVTAAEALACGTPAAVAAGGGLPEVVDDGRTGLVTPAGDLDGLATALGRLLDDVPLRRRLGEAAAARASRRFRREAMIEGFLGALTVAAERRVSSRRAGARTPLRAPDPSPPAAPPGRP